jgi:hypothetical protein
MITMTAVAIDWPAMFSMNSMPPCASIKSSAAVETMKEPSSPLPALLQPSVPLQVVTTTEIARIKLAKAQELELRAAPTAATSTKSGANDAPIAFGPLTTRVGTVIFGNVTKRLYHRYWCTTRNW